MGNTTRTHTRAGSTFSIDKRSVIAKKFNDQGSMKNREYVDDVPILTEVDEDGTAVHPSQYCQDHASPSSSEDPDKPRNLPTESRQKLQKSPGSHVTNSLEHHRLDSPTWTKSANGRAWSIDSTYPKLASAHPNRPSNRGRTITPQSEYDEGTHSYQGSPTSTVRFSGSDSDSDDDEVSENEFTSPSTYKGPSISAVRSSGFESDAASDNEALVDELAHSPSTRPSNATHLRHIDPMPSTSQICDPDPGSESLGSSDSKSSDEDYNMTDDDSSPFQPPKFTPGGVKMKFAPPAKGGVGARGGRIPCGDPWPPSQPPEFVPGGLKIKLAPPVQRSVEAQRERMPCEDPDCSATFGRKSDLTRHLKTAKRHKKEGEVKAGRHICSPCGKDFSRSDALRRHQRKFCTSIRRSTEVESEDE
ncbi:hypothetical protein Moror_4253 [Moniliophthora roreri MCA 2997]|uniref:C2H2-type domain-containing protein n=2 Tax=Moniliophthora roreri TaxID=221103 RepID=V2YFX0_MONRO|nr:hypothetical protein Moror_4253 [Moniliophthora roreri MCA 2997]KAI3602754.1 hypothetical protein WG66_008055 [Moniliophthora roreri]